MSITYRKIDLYIISLALLFVFLLILLVKAPELPFNIKDFSDWKMLALGNLLPIGLVIALFYCMFAYCRFTYDLKGATDIPFEITKLEDANYEHLVFLSTYVIPLISFDFSNGRQIIVLVLLLIIMGVIYIRTDLFYANPSLALLGFHIYRANGLFKNGSREGIILICRGSLQEKQKVSYIKLDNRIYYVSS